MIEFVAKVLMAGILATLATAGMLFAGRWAYHAGRGLFYPAQHKAPRFAGATGAVLGLEVGSMILAEERLIRHDCPVCQPGQCPGYSPGCYFYDRYDTQGGWTSGAMRWTGDRPAEQVRRDVGGWISGPCNDPETSPPPAQGWPEDGPGLPASGREAAITPGPDPVPPAGPGPARGHAHQEKDQYELAHVYDQPPAVLHVPPPGLGGPVPVPGYALPPPLSDRPAAVPGRVRPIPDPEEIGHGGIPGTDQSRRAGIRGLHDAAGNPGGGGRCHTGADHRGLAAGTPGVADALVAVLAAPLPGESHVDAWLRAAARRPGVAAWFARELEAAA